MSRIENPRFVIGDGGLHVITLMPCIGEDGELTNTEQKTKADPFDWRTLLNELGNRIRTEDDLPQELAQNE